MTDAHHTATCQALRLTVNNHPGVLSHVCGLFARRAFNLQGVLAAPLGDGATSIILLIVNENGKMEQVIQQVRKLHDVLEARVTTLDADVLTRLAERITPESPEV